jgi:ATP-binding cassette subfamily B multidrug efflux pump
MASHGPELVGMLVLVFAVRTLIIALAALVEEQAIVPGFFNMVRWQAHQKVARQSVSFFQNDFAGRLATKVWQAGQATGDFMVSLLQVIWFSVVYAFSTVALVGSLDMQLAFIVIGWLVVFGLLARHFLPRVRKSARESAEANSLVQGRLVDGYSNIQTLKLFGSQTRDDAYIRDGMDHFIHTMLPFTRGLSGIRISLGMTSGVMISAIAVVVDRPLAQGTDFDGRHCVHTRAGAAAQHAPGPDDDAAQQPVAQFRNHPELDGNRGAAIGGGGQAGCGRTQG